MEFVSLGLTKSMGSIPIGFLPSQEASLKAWYRFNSGITEAGAGASQWDDVSGNDYHLKQGTDTNRPSIEADGSLLFDGSDNFMVTDAFTELSQINTMYALVRSVSWTSGDNIYDGIAAAKRNTLFQTGTTPSVSAYAGSSALEAIPDLALGTYGVFAVTYNGASGVIQLNHGTPVVGDVGTNGLTGITLGARYDASQFGNIQIKELILYNAQHDAATKRQVINYLSGVGNLSL